MLSPLSPRIGRVLVLGSFSILNAFPMNAFAAPAKAKPVAGGLMLEGRGVCSLRATFNRGSSNLSGRPFNSINRDQRFRNIVSSSRAQKAGNYSVVVNFIAGRTEGDLGPPRREGDENKPESSEDKAKRLARPTGTFTLALSSPGGFRKGQVLPVLLPVYTSKPRPALALMDYTDMVRIQGRDVFDGSGQRKSTYKDVTRSWVAVSGSARVESVDSEKITFSLKNVRFVVPKMASERNGAKGAFILNGAGQSTFNEID